MKGIRLVCFLTLLPAGACEKKVVESIVDQATEQLHPDLKCAEGTFPAGKPPPAGDGVYCAKKSPNGGIVKEGQNIEWFGNEQRKAAGEYREGKKNGPWEFWYPTGKVKEQGSYVGGKKDGFWTTFHPSGERSSEGQMVDGKEHGEWIYWEATGTRVEGKWVLGERDGIWIDYDAEGNAVRERHYRTGNLLRQQEIMKGQRPKKVNPAKKSGG